MIDNELIAEKMSLENNNLSASIIVTAYNRRRFLLDALRSIVRQTIGGYEVIVVRTSMINL
jgi:GT2 family glycosyltransferase